jgi:hypothetical protein
MLRILETEMKTGRMLFSRFQNGNDKSRGSEPAGGEKYLTNKKGRRLPTFLFVTQFNQNLQDAGLEDA